MVDKGLDSLIAEYLSDAGYIQTLAKFKTETSASSKKSPQQHTQGGHAEFIEAFECGEGHAFFQLWKEYIPQSIRSDNVPCQHLECNISAYFAVYPIRTGIGNKEEAMSQFRSYLDQRGSVISQNQDLASYFALPYIPDPSKHPSFQNIFLESWSAEVRARLIQFLEETLPSQSSSELVAIYLNSKKLSGAVLQEDCIQRVREVQDAYHILCGISMELVGALESSVAGKQITPDFISGICSRLFENRLQPVPDAPPRPSTNTLRASIISLRQSMGTSDHTPQDYPSLNFDKVKEVLQSGTTSEQTQLIQALRWRLTRSLPGPHREAVLTSYLNNDLLGCHDDEYGSLLLLMEGSSDPSLSEQIARLFNAFSSLTSGRSYLSRSTPLITALLELLYKEKSDDTPTRRNALGAIQKLSLRQSISRLMIKHSIVKWIVEDVLSETESLSDYTLRYSLALLMNISLRTIGRSACAGYSNALLESLGGMLEHEEEEISEYVNGTLYSLFSSAQLQREARAMGMDELLEEAFQVAPAQRKMQLQYIRQQLNQKTTKEEGEELEDSGDEGQEDDEDEESDPDMIEGDEGEVVAQDRILRGEDLLTREYLLTNTIKRRDKAPSSLSTSPLNSNQSKTSKKLYQQTKSLPTAGNQPGTTPMETTQPGTPPTATTQPGPPASNRSGSPGTHSAMGISREDTLVLKSIDSMRPVTPQSFRSQSLVNVRASMPSQQPLRHAVTTPTLTQ